MKPDPEEIQKKILSLTPDEQMEIIELIDVLENKKKINNKKTKLGFNWIGGLKELKDKYTSVELQHKINEWRI